MSKKKEAPPAPTPAPAPKKKAPARKAAPAKPSKTKPEKAKLLQKEEQDLPLKELTPSELLFVEAYMVDLNGTQSYMKANPNAGYGTARVMACRWLAKPNIQAKLMELRAEQSKRLEIDSDAIVRGVLHIAEADHRELSEYQWLCCRYCHGVGFRYQRTQGELDSAREEHEREQDRKEALALLKNKGFDRREFDERGGAGFNRWKDPHKDCPECMGKGEGRTVMKDTRNLSEAGIDLYAGVEETKEGLKVKAHDKLRAKDMLFRHQGLYEADNSQKADSAAKTTPEAMAALYAEAQQAAQDSRAIMAKRRLELEEEDRLERKGGGGAAEVPAATGAS